MRSGCLRSQGGAFLHCNNVTLSSSQHVNARPLPVVHPEDEIQNNMVAPNYSGDSRLAGSPGQWQQGYAQSQQNFQRAHHQQEPRTGLQYPIPEDSSRRDVSIPLLKGSHLNSNAKVQQRQLLNCHSSGDVRSTVLEGSCKVAANSELSVCFPLLCSLLTAPSDDHNANIDHNHQRHDGHQQAKRTAALNLRLNGTQNPDHSDTVILNFIQRAVTSFKTGKWGPSPASDKGNATVGQAPKKDCSKGSKANMDSTAMFEESRTTSASTKHLQGTLVSTVDSKHPPISEFVKRNASLDLDLSVKKHLDVTMPENGNYNLVNSDVCEDKMLDCVNEHFHSKWCDKYLQNGMASLHYSPAALKELIASLENVETFAEVENFAEVILQQYWNGNVDNVRLFASTEYPQIMWEVAATCGECKDEGPAGVPMAVRGAMQSSSMLKHSSPKEENASHWLNSSGNVDAVDKELCVSWTPKHMMDKGQAVLKPAQAVGWHDMEGFPAKPRSTASEPMDNTHKKYAKKEKRKSVDELHSVTSKEAIAHSEPDSSLDKIQITNVVSIPVNQSEWLKDVHSQHVGSQTGLNVELSGKKDKTDALLSESQEAQPQYEDISDDGTNEHCEKLSIPHCLKDPQYDDISDAECPCDESVTVTTSPEPKLDDDQSPFESNSHGHVQNQALIRTEALSHLEPISKKPLSPTTRTQDCSSSGFVGTEDVMCTKCDRMTQTNYSVPHAQYLSMKEEAETEDEMDYVCLPVSILDIKFEPADEDQGSPEAKVESVETGDQERRYDTILPAPPKPTLAMDFPQVPVYETNESFLQAGKRFHMALEWSTPESVMDKEGAQNRRQSVDNSDTEDSCDYSSDSEKLLINHLTPSRQMLQKVAPQAPKMDDPPRKDAEVSNAQNGHTKRADKLLISKHNQEVVIVSDTEDESEQSCVKRLKRKKKRMNKVFLSSDSEDGDDVSEIVDHQRGTVNGRVQNSSPAPPCQAIHGTPSEAVMEGETCENSNAAPVQDNDVIVINSDTEEEEEEEEVQNCKKPHRKIFSSSHSDSEPETEDSEDGLPEETRPDQRNVTSSETEDSSDNSFTPKNESTVDPLCGAENNRFSENSPEPQSVDREPESTTCTDPVIPRLIVVNSSPSQSKLLLFKDDRLDKDGHRAPQTSVTFRKKTGFCLRNKMDSPGINMAKSGLGASKSNVQVDIPKPRKLSRQLSLTGQEDPSTSSLPSTSGHLSEAQRRSFSRSFSLSGETSASSSRPTSMHSASIPRHLSGPKPKGSQSYGTTAPSSAPKHSDARQQIMKDWKNNHVPTRQEKKRTLGLAASRLPQTGLCREARPGRSHHDKAPRKRHISQKSETPLMKKTKIVAIQRTKDINRDASKERRCTVGEGYKWSEKPTMAKPTKGFWHDERSRSPPWPQL